MSAHTTQKYYLINLSTRCISISTHLRGDNYTLKSGKCIFLGNLTDELIIKYSKYSALNVSLRIATKDKLESILNKSVNLNNEQITAILEEKTVRQPHTAGSIGETVYTNAQENTNSKKIVEQNVTSNKGLFTQPLPTKNVSVHPVKKQETSSVQKPVENEVEKESVILEQNEVEQKEDVKLENDVKETEQSLIGEQNFESVEEKNSEKTDKQEEIGEVAEVDEIDSTDENEEVVVEEEKNKDEQLLGYYDNNTNIPEYSVNEIDVVKENVKQNLSGMSYNELYDLAKERNLLSGKRGRPSKDKLIEMISEDTEN